MSAKTRKNIVTPKTNIFIIDNNYLLATMTEIKYFFHQKVLFIFVKYINYYLIDMFFKLVFYLFRLKDTIVDVFYVFETQKLVHRPGLSRFRQQWLNDIISLKESLIKDCKF